MLSKVSFVLINQFRAVCLLSCLLAVPTYGQSDLSGVIDFHVHQSPDSVPRAIDADDLARLAKERGMRGLVMKNHWESTAAIVYIIRKEVPGIELFGGITQDLSVGGINPAAVERMVMLKGGYGKVVWMPTFDAEAQVRYSKENRPFVPVSKDGHLLPAVLEVIDLVAKHQLVLETGHLSAEEGLLVVHEAHQRGVQHMIITHAMRPPTSMTIPQMQDAAREGAYIEFCYGTLGEHASFGKAIQIGDYVKAIRAVGPEFSILSTDLGRVGGPLPPDGMAMFLEALRKEGISQADLDIMSKVNPARALGLK